MYVCVHVERHHTQPGGGSGLQGEGVRVKGGSNYIIITFTHTNTHSHITLCKHTATRILIWRGCPAGGR